MSSNRDEIHSDISGILRSALDELFEESNLRASEIKKRVENLNRNYILNKFNITSEEDALAYALYFLPEHIPKIFFVYSELLKRFPALLKRIEDVYDLGCGSGTAGILINLIDPDRKRLFLIDKNPFMLSIAAKILKRISTSEYIIIKADFLANSPSPKSPSLFLFMNSLSENRGKAEESIDLVSDLLELNQLNTVIIIEPIKSESLEMLKRMREIFAEYILAPCPSPDNCPLSMGTDKICRFNIRQDISIQLESVINANHRFAKFCYLVLSRTKKTIDPHLYRVLTYPDRRKYGFDLQICNGSEILNVKVLARGGDEKSRLKIISPNDVIKIHNLPSNRSPNINSDDIEINKAL